MLRRSHQLLALSVPGTVFLNNVDHKEKICNVMIEPLSWEWASRFGLSSSSVVPVEDVVSGHVSRGLQRKLGTVNQRLEKLKLIVCYYLVPVPSSATLCLVVPFIYI